MWLRIRIEAGQYRQTESERFVRVGENGIENDETCGASREHSSIGARERQGFQGYAFSNALQIARECATEESLNVSYCHETG